MKTYLEDLKTALTKRKFSEKEINDILADHEEMITEALAAGLDTADIAKKFGSPEKVASDIAELCQREQVEQNAPDGYQEAQSFELTGSTDIDIKLISEDLVFETDGGTKLRVYYKGDIPLDRYEINLSRGSFLLRRKNGDVNSSWFHRNDMDFVIRIPGKSAIGKLNYQSTSSDSVFQNLKLESFAANTTSGDAMVNNLCGNSFKITSVSGDIHLNNLHVESLNLSEVSGDALIEKTQVKANIEINSVSGDVKIIASECKTAAFRTVSGDMNGEEFYPESVELKSVSGDMVIKNTDHFRVINVKSAHSVSGDVSIR